jgi:hypothetical protein
VLSSPSLDSYHRSCTYPPAFASKSHYVRSIYPDPRILRSTTCTRHFRHCIVSRSKTVIGIRFVHKGRALARTRNSCTLVSPSARTKELEFFTVCLVPHQISIMSPSSHAQRRRVQQQSSAFPTRQLFVLGMPRYLLFFHTHRWLMMLSVVPYMRANCLHVHLSLCLLHDFFFPHYRR